MPIVPDRIANGRLNLGSRATVATLVKKLEDATVGNKDGIVGNETQAAGQTAHTSLFDKNPMLFRMRAQKLTGFMKTFTAEFGPVTSLAKPADVSASDWDAHLVDKAITLVRLGRTPTDVEDKLVHASGSVNGADIKDRDVFTQKWRATGAPKNETVVISPGFLETGRNYTEQIQLLNAKGYDVVVMDHQWAGLSSGKKGGIDRGFGIARDVAAVVADAAQSGQRVSIMGTSMGGGAGATLAVLMNNAGKVKLNGPPMPKNVDAVLQDPFFARSPGLLNDALSVFGRLALLNQIPLAAMGAPILSGDQATLRKLAAHGTTEHLTAKAQAFHASDDDLATSFAMLQKGELSLGGSHVTVVHATKDTLADFATSKQWADAMGAKFQPYESTSHVPEENLKEQALGVDALVAQRPGA